MTHKDTPNQIHLLPAISQCIYQTTVDEIHLSGMYALQRTLFQALLIIYENGCAFGVHVNMNTF